MTITRFSILLALSAVALAAQTNPPASTASPALKPKTKAVKARPVAPLTIPAGAVKSPDGDYHYKDAQGKAWIYRQTPFGVTRAVDSLRTTAPTGPIQTPFGISKTAAAPPPAAPAGDPTDHITATAQGDTIHFQKPTPFGITHWEKNKNDLTAEEQKVWDREQAKGTH